MENFTPISATIGGALIGLSASILLLCNGRVAGISGIIGGLFNKAQDKTHRMAFFAGLLFGGTLLLLLYSEAFTVEIARSPGTLLIGGLLVGLGTRIGSGCTSGHGVCGLSRLSFRSLVATCTFMACGFITVTVITQFLGGSL